MNAGASTVTPLHIDTSPPDPENVEPAGQQPSGPKSIATGNNPLPRFDSQAHGLVPIRDALQLPVWISIRQACLKREVWRHG